MISKKVNISKSSVSLILRDSVQKKRSIIKPQKIGRPKKLTDRDRRKLIRTINTIRNEDTNFTVQRLLAQSGPSSCEISYHTIYREVKAAGFNFLPVRKKGVVTNGDRSKKAFARECKKLLSTSPNFFTRSIAFYLDGVSFVHKTRPLSNALAPRGRVWRKRSEGIQVTAKGSKSLAGGTRLHLLVAISYKQGVVMVEEYKKMTGKYSWFVRNKFLVLFCFRVSVDENGSLWTMIHARKAIEKECCELVCIPARSLDLNPIENMFHTAKIELERQVIDSQIVRETLQEFKSRVIKTLHNISVDHVDYIITTMPKRINAVLQRNGYRL